MPATFKTALTRLLGIEVPILQAPMGALVGPRLAAAVSNAGGLGMLNLTWHEDDQVVATIDEMRALTDRPFAANLLMPWATEDRVRQLVALDVKLISTFWGDPAPFVAPVHEAGGILIHTVGSADEARRVVADGVDVVVAQGWEAGGHVWGSVASLVLVPAVVDAVHPTPVIAAGGIADGRGLAAVLALGASGAWLGTRFLLTPEALAHPDYAAALLRATETSTIHATLYDLTWRDAPHRTLRNSTSAAWEAAGRPVRGRPGEGDLITHWDDGTPIVRYQSASPLAGMTGNIEQLPMWAGQSVGLVREIMPAGDVVRAIVAEAAAALSSASSHVRGP
jgi:nitronate monooxygenase